MNMNERQKEWVKTYNTALHALLWHYAVPAATVAANEAANKSWGKYWEEEPKEVNVHPESDVNETINKLREDNKELLAENKRLKQAYSCADYR